MGFSSSIIKQRKERRERERGEQQVSKLCEFPRDKGFRTIKRRTARKGVEINGKFLVGGFKFFTDLHYLDNKTQ